VRFVATDNVNLRTEKTITSLVVFWYNLCGGEKVAVPSLLKQNCKCEPYLIATSQLN
jgi:hypothetical protein